MRTKCTLTIQLHAIIKKYIHVYKLNKITNILAMLLGPTPSPFTLRVNVN